MVITVLAPSLCFLKRPARLIAFPVPVSVAFLNAQPLPLQVSVTFAPAGTPASVSLSTRVSLPNSRQPVLSLALVTGVPAAPLVLLFPPVAPLLLLTPAGRSATAKRRCTVVVLPAASTTRSTN